MKISAKNINLTSVDDLFSTEESRTDANREKVMEIPLTELFPFKDHPFKVIDNEAMFDTAESVKQYGVLVPAIARPRDEGGYAELLSAKKKAYAEYVTVKKSMQEVQTAKANVDRLLGYDDLLKGKEKTQEQR